VVTNKWAKALASNNTLGRWVGGVSVAMALLAVVSLTGCGTPKQASKSTVVTLWTMQLGTFASVINPMLRQFEQTHPGVTVQWVDVPFTEMEKRVFIGLLSQHPPDVVNLNPTFSARLAQRGALVDMATALPAAVQTQYLPVAWSAATLQPTPGRAGVRFGVPWYLTTALTLWNTERMPDGPPYPTTWPALIKQAPLLKGPKPVYVAMPVVTDHGSVVKWLGKQGATPCSPNAASLASVLVQGLKAKAFSQEVVTASNRTAVEQFQQGNLAMLEAGSTALTLIADNAPRQLNHMVLTPQFTQPHAALDVATMVLAVPVTSHHKALALQLATHLTNAQNQLALAQAAPVLPSHQQALQRLALLPVTLKGQPVANPQLRQLLYTARQLGIQQLAMAQRTNPTWPHQPAIDEVADYQTQAMLLGQQTPAQAMQRICHTIQNY
jgi:putative chitobiose transport system substrate-binding protein